MSATKVSGKLEKKRKLSDTEHAANMDAGKEGCPSKKFAGKKQDLNEKRPPATGEEQTEQSIETKDSGKKNRYILYVTNIPYDAVKEDIAKHFGALKEKILSIRMLTDKGTGQFRGTCFLDCADKESFSVALKLHHTKILGRKIVVEPTVGGGGKGQNRMRKLNDKKEKFSQVRKKRIAKDLMKRKKPGKPQEAASA